MACIFSIVHIILVRSQPHGLSLIVKKDGKMCTQEIRKIEIDLMKHACATKLLNFLCFKFAPHLEWG